MSDQNPHTAIYEELPETAGKLVDDAGVYRTKKALTEADRNAFNRQHPEPPNPMANPAAMRALEAAEERHDAAKRALDNFTSNMDRLIRNRQQYSGTADEDIKHAERATANEKEELTAEFTTSKQDYDALNPRAHEEKLVAFIDDLIDQRGAGELVDIARRTGMYRMPDPTTIGQVASVRSPDSDAHHQQTPAGSARSSRASSPSQQRSPSR